MICQVVGLAAAMFRCSASSAAAAVALAMAVTPVLPAETPLDMSACAAAPTPECVLGLAADTIKQQVSPGDGADDPLAVLLAREPLQQFAREAIIGLAEAGAMERAGEVIVSIGNSAGERAEILLDIAEEVPSLGRSSAAAPILRDALATLDPFADWPALTSLPESQRNDALARWVDLVRLAKEAGLANEARAAAQAARHVLGTQEYARLDEEIRTALAMSVVRVSIAADQPSLAARASEQVVGREQWSQAQFEVAASYARLDNIRSAQGMLEGITGPTRGLVNAEIFRAQLRLDQLADARRTLWLLPEEVQADALHEAMRQVSPDAIRAVINVTSRTVQGLARNMLARRLLRDRDYAAAFEEATSIRDAWVRTNAISLIAVEAARAGDGATARDAYNWLDSVRSQGLGADEYFAAAFSAAFARVSLNELGNQERDLDTLNNRMRGILTEADAGSPLNVQVFDLLSLHIDALRVAAGVTTVELQQSASQAGDAADVLFSEVFFAGTAFGFSGEHASPLVRDALEKIAAIDDPQLRLALLVVLGRQMQAREVVVGF